MQAALAVPDTVERVAALAEVFERFGHVYLSSVEMGGMKHIFSTNESNNKVRIVANAQSGELIERYSILRSNTRKPCVGL